MNYQHTLVVNGGQPAHRLTLPPFHYGTYHNRRTVRIISQETTLLDKVPSLAGY